MTRDQADSTLTILMVDDDANILAGMRRTLGRKFRVLTAASGAEALEVLGTEGPVPLCFTDMQMPRMSGLEFILEARKRWPDTEFVMLTGNADEKTRIDAEKKGGVFRFISKPCSGSRLEAVVAQFVEAFDSNRGSDAA